jgi:hypothetical protein
LYLIYMNTGAYNIARSYVDKYIVIWNGAVIEMKLCYFRGLAVLIFNVQFNIKVQNMNSRYQ